MSKFSLDLSDGLTELSALFIDYEHEPRVLDPEDARIIRACIKKLHAAARSLENEVSRLLWNEPALRHQLTQALILAEAQRPGSNLRLFQPICRPFSDGRPGGAA